MSDSSTKTPPPLSFNDAPIDFLSPQFTGRETDLEYIRNILDMNYDGVPSRCAVYGMHGMGKTQLALQYAKLSFIRQRYSVIFWISGATVEKLNQGFGKVVVLVGLPDYQEQSTRLIAARRWLEEATSKWLLVLDNVSQEAVSFLRDFLPRKNISGHILLTTRTAIVAETVTAVAGQQHQIYELRVPDLKDATSLLLRESEIDTNGLVSPSTSSAEALVKCVGCLPFAISQAASFAKQSHKSLDDVLDLYRSKWRYHVGLKL